MKYVEIMRHSVRNNPGNHLNREGVALARRIGGALEPFDLVVTSPITRAMETAVAMGFAIDAESELFATLGHEVDAEISWESSYANFAAVHKKGGALKNFCDRLGSGILDLAGRLRDEGRLLIVTHGGIVQAAAVALAPEMGFAALGDGPSYCEGVSVMLDGKSAVSIEAIKVKY